MANIRKKGTEPWAQDTEEEFLPLAVRTLTINGKRLTPAFYKQISEADLLDESTAELRGIPWAIFTSTPKSAHSFPISTYCGRLRRNCTSLSS